MKKIFIYISKLVASSIIAMILLSIFSIFYYNHPISIPQPDKYTNRKFLPNSYWSNMTEGFGNGSINNIGYNDIDEYNPNQPLIAVLGSSHTEALQVPQDKSFVSLLQKKLFEDDNENNNIPCYNFGISSHSFKVCVSNFEYFTDNFENIECAIIETDSIQFTEKELDKMLEGAYHSDLQQQGTLHNIVQKVPYLRLLYKQYQDIQLSKPNSSNDFTVDYTLYEEKLNKVMKKLSDGANKKDFELAILYHDHISVEDGYGFREDDPQLLEIFKKCCEQNGIRFIDVTNKFVDHFNNTYEHPYGFANTTMGSGHLNKLGHRIIAEELYGNILEMMEGD